VSASLSSIFMTDPTSTPSIRTLQTGLRLASLFLLSP
jgi:hypothetical protein